MAGEALLAAVVGAIGGSFLATWTIRSERGEQVTRGRSRCDHCGVAVRARANVPVLGYLRARGRCPACGGAIDARHPLLEVGCLVIAAASVAARPGAAGWLGAVFGCLLATLGIVDAWRFRLPDRIVLPLLALGLAGGIGGFAPPLADRAWGAAGGYISLTLVAVAYRMARGREGLGRGDAKLLAAIGAWLGWRPLPWVVVAAAAMGLVWTAARAVAGSRVRPTDRLPFGALLALAAWPAWLLAA